MGTCYINNLVSIYKNNAVDVTFEEFNTSNSVLVADYKKRSLLRTFLIL